MKLRKQFFIRIGDMQFSPLRIDKTGRPCKYMILESQVAKQYTAYSLIKNDLQLVMKALNELQIERENLIIDQSLTFFIIITYGKCFVSNKDGRGTFLNDNKVFKDCDPKLLNEHKKIMDLRMDHVAHAGSKNENCYLTAYFHMLSSTFLEGIEWESRMASMACFTGGFEPIYELFNFVLNYVNQSILKLEQKLTKDITEYNFPEKFKMATAPNLNELYTLELVENDSNKKTYDFVRAKFS